MEWKKLDAVTMNYSVCRNVVVKSLARPDFFLFPPFQTLSFSSTPLSLLSTSTPFTSDICAYSPIILLNKIADTRHQGDQVVG